jgi:serine/threonine protein phosphatase PrpC
VLGHGRGSFHGKLDVRVEKFQLPPGAQLLLFSDGLSNQLRLPFQRQQSLEELAAQLFSTFVVSSDDATLLALSTSR